MSNPNFEQVTKYHWFRKKHVKTVYVHHCIQAGGSALRLYGSSDLNTYLMMRGLAPDVVSVVKPTRFLLLRHSIVCPVLIFVLTAISYLELHVLRDNTSIS